MVAGTFMFVGLFSSNKLIEVVSNWNYNLVLIITVFAQVYPSMQVEINFSHEMIQFSWKYLPFIYLVLCHTKHTLCCCCIMVLRGFSLNLF